MNSELIYVLTQCVLFSPLFECSTFTLQNVKVNYSIHCFGGTQSQEHSIREKWIPKSNRRQVAQGALKTHIPGRK